MQNLPINRLEQNSKLINSGNSLFVSLAQKPNNRIFSVISPQYKCGKSTVTLSLAIAIAQSGQRVLIVDADVLNRKLFNKIYGNRYSIGLFSNNSRRYNEFINNTSINGLYYMGFDESSCSFSNVHLCKTLNKITHNLLKKFDYILINSTPVFVSSDCLRICRDCDSAVVVARSEKTKTESMSILLNTLTNSGIDVAGCVLTHCKGLPKSHN